MRFDDSDKVILDSISATEATAYISFLYVERARHTIDLEDARKIWRPIAVGNEFTSAWIEFWKSAERRHLDDIKGIDALIKKVRERFNLEEKWVMN